MNLTMVKLIIKNNAIGIIKIIKNPKLLSNEFPWEQACRK